MRIKQSKEADWPTSPKGYSLAVRERVLKVACELFAEAGFLGTHLRGICKRADANVAEVRYPLSDVQGEQRFSRLLTNTDYSSNN